MRSRASFTCLMLVIIAAALIRIWASMDNFWVDEVSTYYLSLQIDAPVEAVTRVRLDHHMLNTAYMAAVGEQHHWWLYRLLSLVTGIGAVLLIAREAAKRGRTQLFICTIMAGVSYPLIVYGSEARGYAPSIFFVLGAYLLLQEGWTRRILVLRVLFCLLSVLALLSHITAIYPILGMTAWSGYRVLQAWRKHRKRLAGEIIDFIITYAPVYAAFLGIYRIMMASQTIGGDIEPLPLVLMQTCSYLIGAPASGFWLPISAATVFFLVSAALINVFRKDKGRFCFMLVSVLLAPAASLILNPRVYVYPRYFVLSFPFLILLLGEWIESLWQKSNAARSAAIALLVLLVAGHALHDARFIRHGRGGYYDALQSICNHSKARTIAVSGDNDFRVGMMVNYYRRFFEPEKFAYYIPARDWPPDGVDWYITHQTKPGDPQPKRLQVGEWIYQQIAVFPYYGLSGMQWTLYLREGSVDI